MNIEERDGAASSRVLRGHDITLGSNRLLSVRGEQRAESMPRPLIVDEMPAALVVDERAELRAQLEAAERRLEQHGSAARQKEEEAFQRGLAKGREEGKAAAQRDVDAAMRVLESAVDKATAELQQSLDRLEAASAAIALAALEQVLGDDKAAARHVLRSLNRQLGHLREAAVIEIRVSSADFNDLTSVAEVVKRNGHAANIKQDDALVPGQCRIRLGLGEMAIDLPDQLAALRQLLSGTE